MNTSRFGTPCSQLLPSDVVARLRAPGKPPVKPVRKSPAREFIARLRKAWTRTPPNVADGRSAFAA